MPILWCIVALVFIITHKIYKGFILFWFAIGSFLTFVLSFIIHNTILQLIIFLFISLSLTLILTQKFSQKLSNYSLTSKLHELIGKQALVTYSIGNTSLEPGLIKLDGQIWHAVASTGQAIPKGSIVIVDSITGIRAKVTLFN